MAVAALTALTLSASAAAQDVSPLTKLTPASRYAYEVILDSARKAGLPTARLESKALQGISLRKDDRTIINAVRNEFRALREARNALGPAVTNDELGAAASALRAGITTAELSRLAKSRQGKQLTVPLVVLVDLVFRGVPRDTASSTILQLWTRGAGDDDFNALWRGVERDIVSGTDPGVALLNRAREIPFRASPPGTPPSGRPDQSETQDR